MWDQRVVRLALLQQLRAVYGIKVKGGRGQCDRRRHETAAAETKGKVFGVPFNLLPHSVVPEYGHIPSFLVDACTSLEEHIHTEGLFRKSGSVTRLKALKSKLDHGEACLSSALPCDVAGLLKQFFRELPEPVLPADLHEALFKAQQLGAEEKNKATLLLSCLVADPTVDVLRYFFNFLKNVSLRASENKMDSSNLAVIFAPNLLQTNEGHEKMSANTEKKLRLQAAVVQTLIDCASDIGRVPDFILEKIPAMLGIDGLCTTPSLEGFEEGEYETPGECKRKRRQSVGDFVNGALNKFKSSRTPSITPQQDRTAQASVSPLSLTPSVKRKLPGESSHAFSSKKRKSIKHNLNFELLPSHLFSSNSTPVSVHFDTSPEGSSQNSFSPIIMSGDHLISTDLRRSKRIANKKVYRVESGKAGCFSPKLSHKGKVRRSLRLKFSLGKNRDSNGCSVINRYENVGRRLANQQNLKNRIESVKTGLLFSPDIDERLLKKDAEKMSKSEEHLLTPDGLDEAGYRMSWTEPNNSSFQDMGANGASPVMSNLEVKHFSLESDVTVENSLAVSCELRPSTFHSQPDSNVLGTSLSGDESNMTSETLLKIQKAFSESGSGLHTLISHGQSSVANVGEESEASDVTVRESKENDGNYTGEDENCVPGRDFSLCQSPEFGREVRMKVECEEDIHSEVAKADLIQEEFPSEEQMKGPQSPRNQLNTQSAGKESVAEANSMACEAPREDEAHSSLEQSTCSVVVLPKPQPQRLAKQRSLVGKLDNTVPGCLQMTEHGKVSDHIQWFNKLSLNEPNRTKVKSPLKFQRTPVRQSVRRINSLLEYGRQPVRQKKLAILGDAASPLVKSVSCDGALPSCVESTSKDSSVSCTELGTEVRKSMFHKSSDAISKSSIELTSKSFSKVKRHPDPVRASLGTTRLCKQESKSDGQIKFPLDDLTNHDRLKFVVNNNTAFSHEIKNRVLRKPSDKERVWYKGSPKNPIGKTQLLPTSKPVDL
ncbi:rho GTPase-activating protein 11A [Phodopus roborovskii]|uniref:Rho GTPase-activating protein 11A n=1 Tax=Phodopus roborovskii TaxID=109678 RepID=A0AAU9Z5Y5_PHORO|nr:rho GTPase-activating protein 11A [Phodopus roborovskii]CAH6788104.1 Arhgap11a [Phodopus roborovskii]